MVNGWMTQKCSRRMWNLRICRCCKPATAGQRYGAPAPDGRTTPDSRTAPDGRAAYAGAARARAAYAGAAYTRAAHA